MSFLSRIRSYLSSLFGDTADESPEPTGEADEPAADRDSAVESAPSESEPAYRCSICATPVEDPEGQCPLCRSSDVVPADAVDAGDDESGPNLSGTSVTRPDDDEDAVSRLRELRQRAGENPSDDDAAGTPSGVEGEADSDEDA